MYDNVWQCHIRVCCLSTTLFTLYKPTADEDYRAHTAVAAAVVAENCSRVVIESNKSVFGALHEQEHYDLKPK